MKKYFVIVAVVLAFASTAFSQTNNDQKIEREIIKIMDGWAIISGKRDIASTARYLPEDFTITDCDGSVQTKAEYLDALKNLPGNIVIKDTEQKVKTFGDTAVITAYYTVTAEAQKRLLGSYRYMTVFQKQKGKWMPIAFQRVCQAGK